MKKLTFQKQLLLGIIGIGLGHLLSWVTNNQIFRNLGWIFYGLLFVFHPVWPKSGDKVPRMGLYIRFTGVVIVLLGCMLRTGGEGDFWKSRISGSLGIDTAKAEVVETMDDHSGFHGDGTLYAVLSFEGDDLAPVISVPGGWHALPLTEELQTLIYGTITETAAIGPYCDAPMPKVERGYYYFYDRQGDTQSSAGVLSRGSFNYTIAIYDADRELLYYCEYDT